MFSSIAEFLANPLVWKIILGYWTFSAIVGALETPDTRSSKLYRFAFRFLHGMSGNLNRAAVALKVPGEIANASKNQD